MKGSKQTTKDMKKIEFTDDRARLYEEAVLEYPYARDDDIKTMHRLLDPKAGESVLGIGEGNGVFAKAIADAVGPAGQYLVTDPSQEQLSNLVKRVNKPVHKPQVKVQVTGAEHIVIKPNTFDKIWSFGAFHHTSSQTMAIKQIYRALKKGGKAIICDVFQGSKLAQHFDTQVARYCITGHEVKFLSDEFARSLGYLAGFKEKNIKIVNLPQKWVFDSKRDLGKFIYKLHAMTELPGNSEEQYEKTFDGCKEILGVTYRRGRYELNWPMKALILTK